MPVIPVAFLSCCLSDDDVIVKNQCLEMPFGETPVPAEEPVTLRKEITLPLRTFHQQFVVQDVLRRLMESLEVRVGILNQESIAAPAAAERLFLKHGGDFAPRHAEIVPFREGVGPSGQEKKQREQPKTIFLLLHHYDPSKARVNVARKR